MKNLQRFSIPQRGQTYQICPFSMIQISSSGVLMLLTGIDSPLAATVALYVSTSLTLHVPPSHVAPFTLTAL